MGTTTSGAKVETLQPTSMPPPPNGRTSIPYQPALDDLSDEPNVTIQPTKSWAGLDPRYLWTYRELLYFLAWRDLKIRYKQTVLGIVWVILQPLLMTAIFTVFLGKLARVPSDNVPYVLFAYSGLMIWTFFSGAVLSTGNSLVGNAHLITKVYFPRLIIPIATITARLVDLGVAFVMLVSLMMYYRVGITPRIVMVPCLILLAALLALGLGIWTSAVNVRYRDVGIALPVLIQLWMFVSPVVYPLSFVPPRWQLLYSLNPMVGILEGFRALLFGNAFNWFAIGISVIVTLILFVYAAYVFRNHERTFADIV
jgi:lipopolysaccharide transport system permease protein